MSQKVKNNSFDLFQSTYFSARAKLLDTIKMTDRQFKKTRSRLRRTDTIREN